MREIWAIILAAGESKRMGFPKMLLDFNGSTMLEIVIRSVKNSAVSNILVVLGAYRNELVEMVAKQNVNYCYNDNYKDGMLSSVKCGFGNLPADFDAVLIFQGDQPLISPEVVNMLITSFRTSVKGIVIPVHNGIRGHPILIDKKYRNDIVNLDASEGLRALAHLFSDDVLEVEVNDPGILRDFDTYEEYKNNNQIQLK
jgi:molybdenum cofactor cytidylyltransferase